MGQHVVCEIHEIPEGKAKHISVEGRDIAVFNLGDRFAAITSKCPHEGANLCNGRIAAFIDAHGPGEYFTKSDKPMVRCPWHGWEFDLKTGQSYADPKRIRVKSFEVGVSDGSEAEAIAKADAESSANERAEGPYKIEIFEVLTENQYVVLKI